jgi:hypothetical protein
MGSTSPPVEMDAVRGRIAGVLLAHRHEAALHLLNSISDWPRWRTDIASATGAEGTIDFFQPVLFVFIDFLSQYFATADVVWKHLYVGEKLKLLHESSGCAEANEARRQQLAADDQRGLLTIFRRKLSAGDFAEFDRGLADITSLLTTRPKDSVRVLLIGDFLQLDVLALLYAELLEERIALEPTCIANSSPAELHAAIHVLAEQRGLGFDFVFYTPMSDLDCPAIAKLHSWRMVLARGRAAEELAETACRRAGGTIDLLQSLWTCPIIVNNASAIARHDQSMVTRLQHQLTRRAQRRFCMQVNQRLGECVESHRGLGEPLSVFDENGLLAKHDEWRLGQPLPGLERRYPILLGKHIAEAYRARIAARVHEVSSRIVPARSGLIPVSR